MRTTTRVLVGVFLAWSCCSHVAAEESRSWWWPFGGGDSGQLAAAPPTPAPDADDSWLSWPTMPKMAWPEVPTFKGPLAERPRERTSARSVESRSTTSRASRKGGRQTRNSWARSGAEPDPSSASSSPWQNVTHGAQRVGQSTQNAWRKTVDVLTPGDGSNPRVAQRETQPSWWSRMWGADEKQPDGPRTITEWMAQERLNP